MGFAIHLKLICLKNFYDRFQKNGQYYNSIFKKMISFESVDVEIEIEIEENEFLKCKVDNIIILQV